LLSFRALYSRASDADCFTLRFGRPNGLVE
jgi:hypothetical protein